AMQEFLEDYDLGKRQGHYVDATLPALEFPDKFFDLAVCRIFSFFTQKIFLKPSIGPQFSAILELYRLASEVRIFPLLALDRRPAPCVAGIVDDLRNSYEVSVETVPYEFQLGGNQMMRVRALQTEG